jgi:hypothetical protein
MYRRLSIAVQSGLIRRSVPAAASVNNRWSLSDAQQLGPWSFQRRWKHTKESLTKQYTDDIPIRRKNKKNLAPQEKPPKKNFQYNDDDDEEELFDSVDENPFKRSTLPKDSKHELRIIDHGQEVVFDEETQEWRAVPDEDDEDEEEFGKPWKASNLDPTPFDDDQDFGKPWKGSLGSAADDDEESLFTPNHENFEIFYETLQEELKHDGEDPVSEEDARSLFQYLKKEYKDGMNLKDDEEGDDAEDDGLDSLKPEDLDDLERMDEKIENMSDDELREFARAMNIDIDKMNEEEDLDEDLELSIEDLAAMAEKYKLGPKDGWNDPSAPPIKDEPFDMPPPRPEFRTNQAPAQDKPPTAGRQKKQKVRKNV